MLDSGRSERCPLDVSLMRVTEDRGKLVLKKVCYVLGIGLNISILIKKKNNVGLLP